ncbi:MAG: hypothetical protein IT462_07520 [Planctomycetes bacterium]|nr:hypothetical protein [Planctomycetota bacterium]
MPARTTPLKRTGSPHMAAAKSPIKDIKKRLAAVIDLLEANLGKPIWDGRKDALEVLVLTILSQNTTDGNALRAYQNLSRKLPRAKHAGRDATQIPRGDDGNIDKVKLRLSNCANAIEPPDWAKVAELSQQELADMIRTAGLPDSKAGSILAVLRWIRDVGTGVGTRGSVSAEDQPEYRLEPLIEKLGLDAAIEAMTHIKGIGIKTATVTLIEAMGADLCPVDTHVHRIINRLGIVDTKDARDKTFALLRAMIPEGRAYALHHNLLTFGRTICLARGPKCAECPLRKLCPSAKSFLAVSKLD